MAKTVINLMKELGAKSMTEVLDLLRQVGVDTEAEGFGVMSKIDDKTIEKLRIVQEGGTLPLPKPKRLVRTTNQPLEVDLKKKTTRRKVTKDFFGSKAIPEPDPTQTTVPEPQPSSTGIAQTAPPTKQASPVQAKTVKKKPGVAKPQRAKPKGKNAEKLDLSTGPRIISMPNPEEQRRIKEQRQAPPSSDAVAVPPRKKRRKAGKEGDKREQQVGAGKRRIKDIGGRIDENQRVRSKKRVFKVSGQHSPDQATVIPHIKITGPLSLRDVAKKTGIKATQIVRFLMTDLEIMAGINYTASVEEIQLIAENFEIKYTIALEQEPEHELTHFEVVDDAKLVTRPPVVTVMGHVDHGKTKLLDAIRTTNVVAAEAGGITQHIGAYQVEKKGKRITFIDTPGHEAFTAMRARGSQVTDIVILVVAADDGVMPQTVEAINHAKAANVPIIVAVNKIDKADAQPDRVRNQLSEHELVPEEWGGDTVFINISALKKEGIDDILEMILLTAELVDPKADPKAAPFGIVVESQVDTGIGVVATVLVQQGEMAKGQFLLSGTTIGRIKRIENEVCEEIASAGPATPVRIIGFNEPPENGDKVYTFKNKKQAQAIADQRLAAARTKATAGASGRMSLEAFFKKAEEGEIKDLNLIVKADVGGSAEALVDALQRIEVAGAKCNVISSGVGQVNETDVNLAAASNAVIVGFSVSVSGTARQLIEREHVDVRLYSIIYEITEDIENAMKGLLAPEFEERALGRVEIRAIFKQDRNATVCGCYVLDGIARRGTKYRLLREKEVVLREMSLHSLKRFKDDVREVASGFECGLLVESGNVEEGDILEVFEIVELSRF